MTHYLNILKDDFSFQNLSNLVYVALSKIVTMPGICMAICRNSRYRHNLRYYIIHITFWHIKLSEILSNFVLISHDSCNMSHVTSLRRFEIRNFKTQKWVLMFLTYLVNKIFLVILRPRIFFIKFFKKN